MNRRLLAGTAAVLSLAPLAVVPASAAPTAGPSTPSAQPATTFAVIGDVPYGAAPLEAFPGMIDALNAVDAEEDLAFIGHVGDIKAGSEQCTDERLQVVRDEFDRLTAPLVYTPGDNEWVDCHRANNGAYDPLERLATLREIFFPVADRTLGGTLPVDSQAELGLPENVQFSRNRLAFSVIDVQGSNNGLAPWSGLGLTEPTAEQLAEVEHRTRAGVAQLRETFDRAARTNARAVVVMTQADMFTPDQLDAAQTDPDSVSGFRPVVAALAEEAAAFDGPVYLFNGDSHEYTADAPLAPGSPWLDVYGVEPVTNLDRVTVQGSATSDEWLRVSVAPDAAKTDEVLRWERVPFAG